MKKIIILILFISLSGGVYYGWNHRYDYFFKGETIETGSNKTEAEKTEQKSNLNNSQPDFSNNLEESSVEKSQEGIELKNKALEKIIAEDCKRDCENKKGEEDYQYCLEICGLREPSSSDNCEELSGLAKESCYKDKAISEKKFEFCDKISDNNLKEACKNRVSEEIIDSATEE